MGKLKKITALTLASTMILTGQSVFAETNNNNISVVVDGSELTFDTQPIIENGRVLVPFRKIFEALNCAVSYRSNGASKEVVAVNGEKFITAEIGSNTMTVDGEEIKLDAPARIDNGRTLVPLRAVSESLNADVQWNGEEKKVTINKKAGFYKISSVSNDETVKADDGTNIAYISTVYPVIEGSSDFVKKINSEYKAQAEKFVSSAKTEFVEDAKLLYKEMGSEYNPMEFTLSYEVNTNRDGVISITNFDYENTNGAHPSYSKSSRTFNMTDEKELQLIDVLVGEQEGLEQTVYDAFISYLEKNDPGLDAEAAENLGSKLNDVSWYLTDDSLVMYYNPYEIAPYTLGTPTVEIKPENEPMLNLYLSKLLLVYNFGKRNLSFISLICFKYVILIVIYKYKK